MEPAATCDDPEVPGAEVVAGGADEDDEAGALELLTGAEVVDGVTAALLLLLTDAGVELVGAGGAGAEVGAEVGAEETGVVSGGGAAVAVAVDAGALPVGVTWICPSVYSLTGT